MKIKPFLKLVEIQTKTASIIPFATGIAFTLYRFEVVKIMPLLFLLISLLCIDMATTSLNNYMDFKRDRIKVGYHYDVHNAIGYYNLTEKSVIATIVSLLILGAAFGLALVFITDGIVLLLGIVSFGVGLLYSVGPLPISRTPLGEIFSGLFMGFLIFFIVVYCQIYDNGIIIIKVSNDFLHISVNFVEILVLLLVSLPMVMGIANIMLANNISDVKEDVENHRYTLATYLGMTKGLLLFDFFAYAPFVVVVFASFINVLPITVLLVFITLIPIHKQVRRFHEEQSKANTFVNAVMNFVQFSGVYCLSILMGGLIRVLLSHT